MICCERRRQNVRKKCSNKIPAYGPGEVLQSDYILFEHPLIWSDIQFITVQCSAMRHNKYSAEQYSMGQNSAVY